MAAISTELSATIPQDWTISELGKAAHLKNGSAFTPDDWKTTGVPIVRIQNLKDRNAAFNYFQGDPHSKVPLKNGDLVFSWSGSIGTSFGPHYWWGDVAVLNQHIFRVDLKPKTKLTKPFLYYALLHLTKEIESHAYGLAALVHVRKRDLEATRVPVPTAPEQRKIAGVLKLVQRAMEQQEQLRTLTAELKKVLLHQLFTQGLRGETQKQTEIGLLPESWQVAPLGEYLTKSQYGISVKGSESGRYPVLRMTNQRHGRISSENLQYVELTPTQFQNFRVDRGDILFNRTNSLELVGRTSIFDLDRDFVFASYLIRLQTDAARLRPYLLNHYFNWDETQARLKSIATRAVSQSNISATRLRGFLVPVPMPVEQDEIVEKVDCLDQKISVHVRKHATLTDLFRTLLHQLMTAQIRVHDLDLDGILSQVVRENGDKRSPGLQSPLDK